MKKSEAIHQQTVSSRFWGKCSKLKLIAKESQTANHFHPWKPGTSFEKQSNADESNYVVDAGSISEKPLYKFIIVTNRSRLK